MPSNPDSVVAFKISTCGTSEATRPVGINYITSAFQNVRLDEPIQTWKANRVDDHRNLYRFGISGYPYTGMRDDKVTVSIYPEDGIEWHATYKAEFNAYTIEPAEDESKGWTVSAEYSTNPHIVVKDIKYDDTDLLKYQLFCFEATHN